MESQNAAADGHFWWAFADGPVIGVEGQDPAFPACYRRTRAGWSKASLSGEPLTVRSLSSDFTRTSNYQMTICSIQRADYLLRRIRGERDPLFESAMAVRAEMLGVADRMIRQLDWRDFEVLVDLIFARGGWQRSGVLGKNQPDVDLILTHPTTGETAWVQVKSQASQVQLEDYLGRFCRDGSCDHFFFICHTVVGPLSLPTRRGSHLWTEDRLADAAIWESLVDWLLEGSR